MIWPQSPHFSGITPSLYLELILRKLADHTAVFHQLVEFGEVITSNSAAVFDF